MRVCFCPLTRNPAMKSRAYLSLMAGLSRARLRYREAPRRRPSSVAWRRTMEMAHGYHRSRRQPIRRSKEASHPHPAIQAETSCHTGPAAWAPVLAAPSRHVPSRQVHGPEQEDAQLRLGVQELIRECAYIFVVGTARLRQWRQSRYAILRGTSFTHELRPAFKEPAYLPHNFMYRGNQMVRLHQTARCVDAR